MLIAVGWVALPNRGIQTVTRGDGLEVGELRKDRDDGRVGLPNGRFYSVTTEGFFSD